jgi:hypothetical protein
MYSRVIVGRNQLQCPSRSRRRGHGPTYQRVKRSYHDDKLAHLWFIIASILRRHFQLGEAEKASDNGD